MPATNSRRLVISASKCVQKHVYSIGPFGARVSFASQQRRALNLVWALKTMGTWPKVDRPRAVVIGGGIAGLTVAAALHLHDCAVWVVESEGGLLSVQRRAGHRRVHPSINFWPEELLSWTTKLPFLDWYADTCPTVVTALEEYWANYFDQDVSEILLNRAFSGFVPSKGDQITLKFNDGTTEKADMVFLTTGFGPEKDLTDYKDQSYWFDDKLDEEVSDTDIKWVVSGTGDGGLIDALRITYPGFMTEEMALQLLQVEDSTSFRASVIAIEEEAQDIANDKARSRFYLDKYTAIARNLSRKAKALFPALPSERKAVLLVGRLECPFDLTSAPIHKIILAYSLYKERIVYQSGELVKLSTGRYGFRRGRGPIEDLSYDRIIIRHGATPPLWRLLKKGEVDKLREDQLRLGDYLEVEDVEGVISQDEFYAKMPYAPGRKTHPEQFAMRRADMARDLMRKRFGTGIKVVGSKFEIVVSDTEAADSKNGKWNLPTQLFGIDLIPASGTAPVMRDLV